jgi:hypothetical protein
MKIIFNDVNLIARKILGTKVDLKIYFALLGSLKMARQIVNVKSTLCIGLKWSRGCFSKKIPSPSQSWG